MDKYGVDQGDESGKTAGDAAVCRGCGQGLQAPTTTNVKICPKCGTKPYEEG